MFCPNCGNRLEQSADFCPNCGCNLSTAKGNEQKTMTEMLSTRSSDFIKPILEKLKLFINRYKKYIIIGICLLAVSIILIILYSNLFGFEKLNWNKEYTDVDLDYITQSRVNLGVNFSNKEKESELEVSTTCGEAQMANLEILWDLSEAIGECKIEVKYKLKRISKKYTVINPNAKESELGFKYDIDYDSDEDLDFDGLSNKEEKSYGTDVQNSDTDMDGLDDYYEIFTSKTDPTKSDSDDDGLSDYDEIELNLNPLDADSKDDGIKDGDRDLSYTTTYNNPDISVEISGKGNIASSTITVSKNSTFNNIDGLLDTVYNFYSAGTIEKAKVKIPYTLGELEKNNLDENNLTLYYFDDDSKKLELIPTTIDKENKLLIVELTHFSKYVVGDKNVVLTNNLTKIMFIIDNSVSMYSEAQMIEAGYNSSTGAIGNDTAFKRLNLTNNMIDMFTGNYRFGVAEFSGNYVNLSKFTDSKDELKKSVNSMKSNWNSNASGTNIISALNSGINEFTDDEDSHYIILLTDGKNTEGSLSINKNSIISSAKKKDIKICVIGLGTDIDTDDISSIAKSTGCDYYNANDSKALDEIYSIVGSDINYNLVDTDGDGKVDGTIVADSGFIVNRDGFSFGNYGSNLSSGGHCYGMATFAELYYTKKLPISFGKKTVTKSPNKFISTVFGIDGVKLSSYSYNLKNTYFANYSNLYDYTLRTNVLKYTFGFNAVGEDNPKDYKTLSGKTLAFNQKYRDELVNSGMYDISVDESKLDKKTQLKKWGVNYNDAESALLNEDKMQSSNSIDNSDKQLLNAIYASFIKQVVTDYYVSSSNFDVWLARVTGIESTKKLNHAGFIELLIDRINSGDVPVISSNYSGGMHAINAISLVQDNKDSNHYYIGVYDNNYPGEKRYVDIKCNKKVCETASNKYYEKSDQPIYISKSLEDDLKYFK